jgi:ankyrin repeat protein
MSDLDERLLEACDANDGRDIGLIGALLGQGADPNAVRSGVLGPRSTLSTVIEHRDPAPEPAVLVTLLESGADINQQTSDGHTALISAVRRHHPHIVAFLLQRGANPNLYSTAAHRGGAPLHVVIDRLYQTCPDEDWKAALDMVDLLLAHGADVNLTRSDGLTPIDQAIKDQLWPMVEHLLRCHAQLDRSIPAENHDNGGSIAMYLKKPKNKPCTPETIIYLHEHGAQLDHRDRWGDTAVLNAAQRAPALIGLLLELGADLESRNDEGQTALTKYARWPLKSHVEAVSTLIEHGAVVNSQDHDGRTPLWHAVKAQKAPIVRLLVDAGADPQLADQEGITPVQFAKDLDLVLIYGILGAGGSEDDWSSLLLKCVISGEPIALATETIRFLTRHHDDSLAFVHEMDAKTQISIPPPGPVGSLDDDPTYTTPRWPQPSRGEAWCRERIVYFLLFKTEAMQDYLSRVCEVLGREVPDSDALRKQVRDQDPELAQRVALDISNYPTARVLLEGLLAGAKFYESNHEGWREWSAVDGTFVERWGGYSPPEEKRWTYESALVRWTRLRIHDGVAMSENGHYSSNLQEALHALGYPTLRAYVMDHPTG